MDEPELSNDDSESGLFHRETSIEETPAALNSDVLPATSTPRLTAGDIGSHSSRLPRLFSTDPHPESIIDRQVLPEDIEDIIFNKETSTGFHDVNPSSGAQSYGTLVGLVAGILAGVILLLLLLAVGAYKCRSRDEGTYDMDESRLNMCNGKPLAQLNGKAKSARHKRSNSQEWYV